MIRPDADALLKIQKKSYTVGNEIIDAILNYYVQMLKYDVQIHIAELCNGELAVNNIELCSILSQFIVKCRRSNASPKAGEKVSVHLNEFHTK